MTTEDIAVTISSGNNISVELNTESEIQSVLKSDNVVVNLVSEEKIDAVVKSGDNIKAEIAYSSGTSGTSGTTWDGSSGTSLYSLLSGTASFALYSGTASFSLLSGTAAFATSAGNAGSSGSSTTAAYAGTSSFASSSAEAGSSGSSTTAAYSGSAYYASTCAEAGSSGSATTAAYAGTSYYASSAALGHANTLDHTQGTDQGLDTGGANAVTAAQAKAGYTHSGVAHAPSDAVSLATVKGDADISDALSKRHSQAHNILSTDHGDVTAAAVVRGDLITGQGATPKWTRYAISVPASGLINYFGVANGDAEPGYKALFDTTNPAALGTVGPGTQVIAARRDHVHAMPSYSDVGAAAAGHLHTGTYDPEGTGDSEATAHVSAHAALITGVHGLVFTAGKTLTLTESLTLNALPIGGLAVATAANTLGSLAVGLTTEILVGGGAGAVPVWTTATGTDAPVRAGSPTFTTQITTPQIVATAASLIIKPSTDSTDAIKLCDKDANTILTVNTSTNVIVVSGGGGGYPLTVQYATSPVSGTNMLTYLLASSAPADNVAAYFIAQAVYSQVHSIPSGKTNSGYIVTGQYWGHINSANYQGTTASQTGVSVSTGIFSCGAGGTITTCYGISAQILNSDADGMITTGYAGYFNNSDTTGSMTNRYGLFVVSMAGAGTICQGLHVGAIGGTQTSKYGIEIEAISGASITNYGLKIGNVSGASTNYAIYTGTGPVRFGDTLTAVGAFGCNAKAAQTAYPCAAWDEPGAGAFGVDSAAHMAALVELVQDIQAALVANGIMAVV